MSDFDVVRDALMFATRNLGRLAHGGPRLTEDDLMWQVPDDALAALSRIEARLTALENDESQERGALEAEVERLREALKDVENYSREFRARNIARSALEEEA